MTDPGKNTLRPLRHSMNHSSRQDITGPANLGDILRNQRKQLGKTRQEIARAIAVSSELLYLRENGLA